MYVTKNLVRFMNGREKTIILIAISKLFQYSLTVLSQIALSFVIISLFFEEGENFPNYLLLFLISQVVIQISQYIFLILCEKEGGQLKNTLRRELFHHLCRRGVAYRDSKQSSELITTIWQKVEWVGNYYLEYIPRTLAVISVSALVSAYIFFLSSKLMLIFVCTCCFLLLSPVLFYPFMEKGGKENWKANDSYINMCLEGLKGIQTMKSFHATDRYVKKTTEASEKSRKIFMSNLMMTTANSKVIEFCLLFAVFFTFVYGISLGLEEKTLVTLFFLLLGWKSSATEIIAGWLRGNNGITAIDSLLELYDGENIYGFPEVKQDKTEISGNIVFENVSFSYGQEDVLQNISFTVEKGKTIAFVGASGSGKTTLSRLLFGFYKPKTGKISIGGVKLEANTVESFQKSISTVWQENHIFLDTCYHNVALAKENATTKEVQEACQKANIHQHISSLPNGYDTLLGDGGATLSGGEQQRIAIARAFLRNSEILILDEATSSLDRNNEESIRENLMSLSKNKTVFMIAHRLKTVENADEICVLNKGAIVERGTHEELMALKNHYFALVEGQKEEGGME